MKNVSISLETTYQHQSYDQITSEFQIIMLLLKKVMRKWRIFLNKELREAIYTQSCLTKHSLKSGPKTQDPETRNSRTLRPGTLGPWYIRPRNSDTWDQRPWNPRPGTPRPGTWDPGTWDSGTLELGPCNLRLPTKNLTLGTLEMEPWDSETSNWPPPEIYFHLWSKFWQ